MRGAESSGTTHTGTVRLFSLFVTDNFKLVYWVQLAALQAPPVAPATRYVYALSEVSRLDSPPPHVRGIGCAGCCILHERRFAPARASPQTFSKGGCPQIPPALSAAAMARRLRGGSASWAQGAQSFPRAGRVRGAARHCARAGAQTPAKPICRTCSPICTRVALAAPGAAALDFASATCHLYPTR